MSGTSDVFVDDVTSEGRHDLLVIRMKLRSEKNVYGDEGRSAEVLLANATQPDSFEEGNQTLI